MYKGQLHPGNRNMTLHYVYIDARTYSLPFWVASDQQEESDASKVRGSGIGEIKRGNGTRVHAHRMAKVQRVSVGFRDNKEEETVIER